MLGGGTIQTNTCGSLVGLAHFVAKDADFTKTRGGGALRNPMLWALVLYLSSPAC